MVKRTSIPAVFTDDPQINTAIDAIKENIELMNGSRGGSTGLIPPLATTAALADCIAAINLILIRINYDGS